MKCVCVCVCIWCFETESGRIFCSFRNSQSFWKNSCKNKCLFKKIPSMNFKKYIWWSFYQKYILTIIFVTITIFCFKNYIKKYFVVFCGLKIYVAHISKHRYNTVKLGHNEHLVITNKLFSPKWWFDRINKQRWNEPPLYDEQNKPVRGCLL